MKVLTLAAALAFILPVVGYCDSTNFTQKFQYSGKVMKGELFYAVKEGDLEKVKKIMLIFKVNTIPNKKILHLL